MFMKYLNNSKFESLKNAITLALGLEINALRHKKLQYCQEFTS